jgi:4'-phosphopantetheinyl transferase
VCVLSDEEIGVDIEEIRRFKPSLVSYTMNDAQRQMIAAAEHPEVEFIRLWTMKEALLKLTGLGLRTDLKTLDLSGYRFTTRVETQKGYVCTVCQK